MSDPTLEREAITPQAAGTPARDGMAELRELLLKEEQGQIVLLKERLDNPAIYARELSRALPDAIALRPKGDKQLGRALMPTVDEAISVSVKQNPHRWVSSLFPLMGPAIRRAIANAFAEMVQSLNKTLEYGLSWRGLKWRLEALRTGKSFAEVVLSHTLLYRVEQVFLIHRATGLLLQHVSARHESQDADLISGMLTAIQDFVHDSLGGEKNDSLEALRVGDLTVWVEQGPRAVLAAVIRGSAPHELRVVMQDTLDTIHVQFAAALESCDGDSSAFEGTRTCLNDCLRQQLDPGQEKNSSRLVAALAVLILLALAAGAFLWLRQRARWNGYVARLKSQPGIVLVSSERSGGKYVVMGLRDPLSTDPAAMLADSKLSATDVEFKWELYQSSQPHLVLKRVNALLRPPPTLTLAFDQGVLSAQGAASQIWTEQATRLVTAIPAVTRFDTDRIVDLDQATAEIQSLTLQIESYKLSFDTGSSEIRPDQLGGGQALASPIRRLAEVAAAIGQPVRVEVEGHADRPGGEAINIRLRQERAERMHNLLTANGVSPDILVSATDSVQSEKEFTRAVTFRVVR